MVEQELIEKCKNGDLQSFRELIGSVSPFAFSVAFRILGDEETAKDVVQDSMVTIWQKLGKIRSTGSFNTWLYRIVINRCYDQLRINKRKPEFRPDERTWQLIADHIAEKPSTEPGNEEISRLINLLTGKLSPKQKVVFVLSEIEEKTADEVSEITGMSKILVKANLYHARKQISEMLEKYLKP